MNRKRLIYFAVAGAALFLVFNPVGKKIRPIAGAGRKQLESRVALVREEGLAPAEYLAGLFENTDVVILGEFPRLHEPPAFVAESLPSLYAAGVRVLAIEHVLSDDQEKIDAILGAPEYDAAAVHELLFRSLLFWGYEEYANLFRAAWELNRSLEDAGPENPGCPAFRILGLNRKYDWSFIQTEKDLENKTLMAKVLGGISPDQYMVDVLLDFLAGKDSPEKVLVFTSMQYSFTRYRDPVFVQNALDQGIPDAERMGVLLYEALNGNVKNVLIHGLWQDSNERYGFAYPAGGAIDQILKKLGSGERHFGIDVKGSLFGEISLTGKIYKSDRPLTLGDLCDGYICLGGLPKYSPATAIPDFVNEDNIGDARKNFPGPDPGDVRPDDLNHHIASLSGQFEKIIQEFRY